MIDVEERLRFLDAFLDQETHLAGGLGISPEQCVRDVLLKEIRNHSERQNSLEAKLVESENLVDRLLVALLKGSTSPWARFLSIAVSSGRHGHACWQRWKRQPRLMHSRMRRLARKGLIRYQGDRHVYNVLEVTPKGREEIIRLGLDRA